MKSSALFVRAQVLAQAADVFECGQSTTHEAGLEQTKTRLTLLVGVLPDPFERDDCHPIGLRARLQPVQ